MAISAHSISCIFKLVPVVNVPGNLLKNYRWQGVFGPARVYFPPNDACRVHSVQTFFRWDPFNETRDPDSVFNLFNQDKIGIWTYVFGFSFFNGVVSPEVPTAINCQPLSMIAPSDFCQITLERFAYYHTSSYMPITRPECMFARGILIDDVQVYSSDFMDVQRNPAVPFLDLRLYCTMTFELEF